MIQFQEIPGGVCASAGFEATGIHSGVKRKKKDLSLIYSPTVCRAAATFTLNRVQAAPLHVTREHLKEGAVRAIVVNSGNANACNGPQGLIDARRMAELTAEALKVQPNEVLVASTGVIGEPLEMDKIEAGILEAAQGLHADGGTAAAEGIMTTDTVSKEVAFRCEIDDITFHIGGMAKGSGMIHPNMATMLAFITTDASVEPFFLQAALQKAVDKSFNLISVDGDTSTNDMAIILANGRARGPEITADSKLAPVFQEALDRVCIRMARMIAADGEGATKLIEISVQGARSEDEARAVVRAVSKSPLVKTAVFGEDANWGRIVCATGYSGAAFDPDHVRVSLGDIVVFDQGMGVSFDPESAKAVLADDEVRITIDLGAGSAEAVGWTCDLTYDYVKINASYRT